MRPKLLLLVLCTGVLLGQNEPALVGLPGYGVTLTGTPEHPEIVNNSGRTILAYVIWHRDANGGGPVLPTLKTRELRTALVRPASASAPTAAPPQSAGVRTTVNGGPIYTLSNGGVTGGNIIQAVLQNVIFDDGQFVGTDRSYYFDILSARIDGERSLAQSVSGKQILWDELQAQATQWRNERTPQGSTEERLRQHEGMMLAAELLSVRAKYGEAAAPQIADWSAKLPVVWRAQ